MKIQNHLRKGMGLLALMTLLGAPVGRRFTQQNRQRLAHPLIQNLKIPQLQFYKFLMSVRVTSMVKVGVFEKENVNQMMRKR